MKISELAKNKTIFSAEVFPPKKSIPEADQIIAKTLDGLKDVKFDFISVTLGAGGSEETKEITCRFASAIKSNGVEPMVHIPAYAFSKVEISDLLVKIKALGVSNILALRGDKPIGKEPKMDFAHASDLVKYIKNFDPSFDISGACYPEVHPDSKDPIDDILNLKKKVDAGADHLISQLFFDNEVYYQFVDKCRLAGINCPIEAGIMPCINKKQIEKMVSVCGASLPAKFVKMMQRYGDSNESMLDAGIAYATNQIVDLLSHGVDGIHLYIMNNVTVAKRIYNSVVNLI